MICLEAHVCMWMSFRRNKVCIFTGAKYHPARFDPIRLAIETSECLNVGEADTLEQARHFGQSVKPDIVAYRIVAAPVWIHDDEAYPHAAGREIERPVLDI